MVASSPQVPATANTSTRISKCRTRRNALTNSSMTSWIPYSALDYSGTAISGIGGSSLAGMGGGGADYTGVYPVNVDNTSREISVDSLPLVTDSSMTAYGSAGSSVIGVNMDILSGKQDTLAFAYNTADQISSINGSALGGMDEAAVSGIASAYAQSAASGKLDTSAFNSGDFYSISNPSGFITGVDLSPYQPTSAMSAYATTAYMESGLSGKENVFSAGTGLEFVQSGSDRVLQVEAPVDIVAGPGIVIDNPDGNTLRVSVAQDEEVVLWSGTKYWWNDTSNLSLSEAASNFEVIRVKARDDWELPHKFIFFPGENAGFDVSLIGCEGGNLAIKTSKFSVSGSTVSLAAKFMWQVGSDKTVAVGTTTSFIQFNEIVGIHRIQGGS